MSGTLLFCTAVCLGVLDYMLLTGWLTLVHRLGCICIVRQTWLELGECLFFSYLGFGVFCDQKHCKKKKKKITMTQTVLLDIAMFKAFIFLDPHYCPVLIVCRYILQGQQCHKTDMLCLKALNVFTMQLSNELFVNRL